MTRSGKAIVRLAVLLFGVCMNAEARMAEREIGPGQLDEVPFGVVIRASQLEDDYYVWLWASATEPGRSPVLGAAYFELVDEGRPLAGTAMNGTQVRGGFTWSCRVASEFLDNAHVEVRTGYVSQGTPQGVGWQFLLGPLLRESCEPLDSSSDSPWCQVRGGPDSLSALYLNPTND